MFILMNPVYVYVYVATPMCIMSACVNNHILQQSCPIHHTFVLDGYNSSWILNN